MMVFIDDSPVGNDEQDTATNTESQDNPVSTNGKENSTLPLLLSNCLILILNILWWIPLFFLDDLLVVNEEQGSVIGEEDISTDGKRIISYLV